MFDYISLAFAAAGLVSCVWAWWNFPRIPHSNVGSGWRYIYLLAPAMLLLDRIILNSISSAWNSKWWDAVLLYGVPTLGLLWIALMQFTWWRAAFGLMIVSIIATCAELAVLAVDSAINTQTSTWLQIGIFGAVLLIIKSVLIVFNKRYLAPNTLLFSKVAYRRNF